MNLALVKSENFGSVQCDIWQNENNDVYMTREQIGAALEYSDPRVAITKIHARNKERLDKFSVSTKLVSTDGKQYETVVYDERGIYEVIRFSKQARANDFFDFVYDLLERLRKGELTVISPVQKQELEIKRMNAEARLINAKVRQAKLLLKSSDGKRLSAQSVELLNINAMEMLTDKPLDSLPEIQKTYTASQIGNELGISANKVGRIANKYELKTDEYGITVLDKSKHSSKQVPTFLYYEAGRQKIIELHTGGN